MRGGVGPLLPAPELGRLADGGRARAGSSRSPTQHPEAAVVGPRLLNPDGTLQRSVRGFPTLWRLATEYFFLRKLAPRSQALNAFYAGGFDHDEVREVEFVMGACMLVRREAVEQVGPLDEAFFLFSEETDWCYRFREAGWKVRLLPGRRVRARRRRLARRPHVPREPARPPALPRQAPRRCATPSARGGCCSSRCGCAGCSSAASAAACTARPPTGSASGEHPGAARPMTLVQLVLANVGGARCRARSSRGRSASRSVSATLGWSLALIFGALAVTFAVGSSLSLTLAAAARGRRRRGSAFARSAPRAERIPGRRWVLLRRRACSGSCSGTSPGTSAATGSSISRACGSWSSSTRSRSTRVNEFADGGLHPGYAFPLWHGFLALVAQVGWRRPGRGRPARGDRARAARARSSPTRPAGRSSGASARPSPSSSAPSP